MSDSLVRVSRRVSENHLRQCLQLRLKPCPHTQPKHNFVVQEPNDRQKSQSYTVRSSPNERQVSLLQSHSTIPKAITQFTAFADSCYLPLGAYPVDYFQRRFDTCASIGTAQLTPNRTLKVVKLPNIRPKPAKQENEHATTTGFHCFPFSNFKHFLTLFSKFFSSFPHGTCSLSVSRRYLALDGIYHPFWAAFPNNPTR